MVFDLSNKTALITGAGSSTGIGFATAKFLKSMGAKVFITGKSERIKDRAQELNCPYFIADLTKEEEVKQLIEKINQEFKSLDVLVNNAGMTSVVDTPGFESGSIENTSHSAFIASVERNLVSAFLVTKECLELLKQSKSARVIMITSITGPVMAMHNEVGYASSKAGLVGLTRSLALDFAKDNILVNAIAPGWIQTESQTELESKAGLKTPLKRSAKPEEIASLVGYLASDEASYVTGQVIAVDGGNSINEDRG
jgi:3-oxoacyl-[acyl-carrier protein] reductase